MYLTMKIITECYATVRSLALPHIHYATLLCVLLRFHMSCYATVRFVALPHIMLGYCAFCCASSHACAFSCTSTCHATLLCVLLRLHMSCYATVRSPALPHVMLRYGAVSCTSTYHATLLRVLLRFHTCVVLDPVLELQFPTPLCIVLLCFAIQSLQIALEWLR